MSGAWIDQLRLHWRKPSAVEQASWPARTRLLDLPKAVVRVREAGSGARTIVLTPDAPVVLEHYGPLIDLLAPHARVVCFEFPGCGFSYPRFGFGFTLEDYVGALRAVLDALEVRRATLAFTCVNALVAMAFARSDPDRVERLALAQVGGAGEMRAFGQRIDFKLAGVPVLATPVIGQLFMAARRDFAAQTWFRIALPKGFAAEAIRSTARDIFRRGGQFCLASIVQGMSRVAPEAITGANCAAGVAWGMADRTHAKTRKESVLDHLPQATLHRLPERGHCPDIEAPEAYSRLLLA